MYERVIQNVQRYALQNQIVLGERLGSGKDGIVHIGKNKSRPADTALKGLRFEELYFREKAAYERLKARGVNGVLGFSIPQLLGYDDELLVIEMTIVERPFVLDFASAYLDSRPEFPPEIWLEWEADKREQFEEDGLSYRTYSNTLRNSAFSCSMPLRPISGSRTEPRLADLPVACDTMLVFPWDFCHAAV
jgi:hypothetical protein